MREYTDKFTDFSKKSISDFILYNSGIEACQPRYSYGPKRRDYHFIHFVTEGKGQLEIEGQTLEVHENQLFIVPANTVSTYTADEKAPWKYAWIGFTGIESLNLVQTLRQASPNNYVMDCADSNFYEERIERILELSQNTLAAYFKINGIMYDIVGNLLGEHGINVAANYDGSVSAQAMRYMEHHYHDDIQISDIAYSLGIHPNYLSAMFKQEIGVSPKTYLTSLKLNKAKKLLTESDDPINVIAGSVGFTDALSFSKFFKKGLGCAPTAYRKEHP
ncbi:AraC family transcriptional regulator [Lactiplantibacillus nangangensis]|uniref:AraC family transcriptional regulator n=1 Tax=Lactiplantibacillus nangangensis TaxID=2559917 RepID=A0ABW1SN75_9LACO|nr:AraC family transcriptional regulator [Lactiplantibacillus nangangensis]